MNPFNTTRLAASTALLGQTRVVESIAGWLSEDSHCVLEGPRGTGKSSIVATLGDTLRPFRTVICYRLRRVHTPDQALDDLMQHTARAFAVPPPQAAEPRARWTALREARYAQHRDATRPILLIDDTHRSPPETTRALCSLLYTLADQHELTFLLAGRRTPDEHLRKDVSDLREKVSGFHEPAPLRSEDLKRLAAPLRLRPGGLNALVEHARGNPYRAVWLCAWCWDQGGRLDPETLGRANHRWLDELLAEHPSDPVLPELPKAADREFIGLVAETFKRAELSVLVSRHLSVRLEEIVADAESDARAHHELVDWCRRTGSSAALALALTKERPRHPEVRRFVQRWFPGGVV
jgi:hypothetical protein